MWIKMTSELKNNLLTLFVLLKLVEKDTSFKLVAYLASDILNFKLKKALAAILKMEVKMTSELKNNLPTLFVLLKLVEKDTSFKL